MQIAEHSESNSEEQVFYAAAILEHGVSTAQILRLEGQSQGCQQGPTVAKASSGYRLLISHCEWGSN